MKLASFKGTRPGFQGLFNRLIRWRFDGPHSHTELVFEPGDGVDQFMPDGSTQPVDGAYWCASAVAIERLPHWSHYRAGRIGGVRFKRVVLDPAKWDVLALSVDRDPLAAAVWFTAHEGQPYNWRLVAKFLSWIVELAGDMKQFACSHSAAAALGHADAWRFDPCLLHLIEKDRANG